MPKTQTNNRMKIRMNIVLGFIVVVGFGILIGKLYEIQVIKGEFYQGKALAQQLRPTTIPAQRGAIYDRNMKTLAASATVWTVTLSPAEMVQGDNDAQLEKIADFLAPLLSVEREKIIAHGQKKNSYYEIIKARIEKDTADQITQFCLENKISCINLVEDTRRYYPYGSLASTVLGFTGNDNCGAYGLEAYYEKTLAGTPGMVVASKTAKSGNMPDSYEKMYQPVDGNAVVLTIDEVIQHSLEKHLETAVIEHQVGNRAVAVAMDVQTGAILGMATKNDFDPNNPRILVDPATIAKIESMPEGEARQTALGQAQFDQWRNKAISDPYEPGSVFKIVTSCMALDLHVVQPTGQYFNCPGYHIVAGRRKACWKAGGHGNIDFTQAVKYSCNPAFMMVGALIGAEKFNDYFDRFGLKEPTGIDLPGEAEGFFYPNFVELDKQSEEYLASSSFGQTFKVTPIQIITAVSAAINGGKLMQPYVVAQVLDASGNVISRQEPEVKRQVISAETSKIIANILEHVVKDPDGSGKNAYVPGYRVGGKTGTSEKLDKREDGEVAYRVASFMGFAPAEDPKVAVLVLLDEPHMDNIFGSVIAAPVVGAIMSDILPYLGVEPVYTQQELEKSDVKVPGVTGKKVHDAISALTMHGLSYKTVGTGVSVTRQLPVVGETCPKGSTVILYTDAEPILTKIAVPNVVGLSGQQANRTILNAGLNIRLSGMDINNVNAVAISQKPDAGEMVEVGTLVTVAFADKDGGD